MRHGSSSPPSNTEFAAGVGQIEEAHVQPAQLYQPRVDPLAHLVTFSCIICRQMCSVTDAKSDFESVLKIKPNHSTAAKELAALGDLQTAFEQLQQLQQAHTAAAGSPQPDVTSARVVLDKVYSLAPDCIPAQLLDAQLEMMQGNYEQVSTRLTAEAYSCV